MAYSGNPTVLRFKTDMLKLTNSMRMSYHEAKLAQADELVENMRGAVPVVTGTLRASIRKRDMTKQASAGLQGMGGKQAVRSRVSILVLAGGPTTTTRYKRSATYQREVEIGSGDTAGIARGGAYGVSYDYALGVEFGTIDTGAKPFFYSSARRYATGAMQQDAETLSQAIEENNKVRELRAQNYSNAGFTRSVGGRGGATVYKGKL